MEDTPTLATLGALTTAYRGFWQISGKRRLGALRAWKRPGGGPGLTWWFVVEPPAGIEPATPSLPWNHQEPLCGPPFSQVAPTARLKLWVLVGPRYAFSGHFRVDGLT